MSIFILFESAWIFFEGAFSLWVSLIETLVHHKLFSKIFFLCQVLLEIYSKKNLCWSLLIVELQSVRCRLATLPEYDPSYMFSWEFSKLSQLIIFCSISSFVLCKIKTHEIQLHWSRLIMLKTDSTASVSYWSFRKNFRRMSVVEF